MAVWVPPAAGRFTSGYGPRDTGIAGASTWHRGVDIAPPIPGQRRRPVVAVSDARVLATGWNAIRGSWVALRHDDGTTTAYQHLDRVDTAKGRRVTVGQQIGLMGNTSTLTIGVHLHFETFEPGMFVLSGNAWVSTGRTTNPYTFMLARGVSLTSAIAVSNPLWSADGLPDLTDIELGGIDVALSDKALDQIADAVWKRTISGMTDDQGKGEGEQDISGGTGMRRALIMLREDRARGRKLTDAIDSLKVGGTDVSPLVDEIKALPAATVAALKAAL